MNASREFYVIVTPGLESLTARELEALGFTGLRVSKGGVTFKGTLGDAAKANLWLRTATRIVARVGEFDAPGRRELAARARRYDWAPFFVPGSALRIHATCRSSRLYHTGLVAEALHKALGTRPAPTDGDAPLLLARIAKDRCTLSFDTSGELLHKRGARQEISRAPLRETLAAGLLLSCGYDGQSAFVDPMCGSGALVLEAASIATRRAPGLERSFALERWPAFQTEVFNDLRETARANVRRAPAPISGSDVHAGALAQAGRNAERAGVTEDIQLERVGASLRVAPAQTGLVAVNPPWGKRVEADASTLDALRQCFSDTFHKWNRGLVAPAALAHRVLPRSATRTLPFNDGGINVVYAFLEADTA